MSDSDQPKKLPSKKARKFFNYSENDNIFRSEDRLGELAILWRVSKEERYVIEYHQVFNELVALGWNDYLDEDAQLPEDLMPPQYLKRKN